MAQGAGNSGANRLEVDLNFNFSCTLAQMSQANMGGPQMASAVVSGVDMNRDGIPDALQRGGGYGYQGSYGYQGPPGPQMASAVVSGVDMNRDGIPDALQRGGGGYGYQGGCQGGYQGGCQGGYQG